MKLYFYNSLSKRSRINKEFDIDNNEESGGLTTWKQKIMKELMKHGYVWDGDAHEANKLFGESYGVDWS